MSGRALFRAMAVRLREAFLGSSRSGGDGARRGAEVDAGGEIARRGPRLGGARRGAFGGRGRGRGSYGGRGRDSYGGRGRGSYGGRGHGSYGAQDDGPHGWDTSAYGGRGRGRGFYGAQDDGPRGWDTSAYGGRGRGYYGAQDDGPRGWDTSAYGGRGRGSYGAQDDGPRGWDTSAYGGRGRGSYGAQDDGPRGGERTYYGGRDDSGSGWTRRGGYGGPGDAGRGQERRWEYGSHSGGGHGQDSRGGARGRPNDEARWWSRFRAFFQRETTADEMVQKVLEFEENIQKMRRLQNLPETVAEMYTKFRDAIIAAGGTMAGTLTIFSEDVKEKFTVLKTKAIEIKENVMAKLSPQKDMPTEPRLKTDEDELVCKVLDLALSP